MPAPVLPATQAAGVATSSWANDVVAALSALINPVRAFLYQSSSGTQAIASSSGTYSPVTWDSAAYDTDAGWTSGSKWTCPVGCAGVYDVTGVVAWAAGAASGSRWIDLARNGSQVTGKLTGFAACPTASSFSSSVTHEVYLGEGDYVELHATQSSGSPVSTASTGLFLSSLELVWRSAA